MSTKHWGEIPKKVSNDSVIPDITADIEKAMDKFCLSEYEDDTDIHTTDKIILPSMDPLMLYAISLHKYTNDMTEMIRVAELATEMNVIPPEDATPPMPVMPEIYVKHHRNSLNYIPKDFTPFSCGWNLEVPQLSEAVVKRLLTKCIVTMFAHIGYETTHQSILDILTDVLEEFFKKFCHKIVVAVENEEKGNSSGFPSAIERVLVETGMGGIKGLNDYYQNRVVKYINVLQRRCKELNDYYATLLIPKSPSPTDKFTKLVKVKVEEDDDVVEIENPEVHLTAFDGDTSVLESGLQLLHTLEAEENLQSLEEGGEEEINSVSPGVALIGTESDISNFSGFTKKKFKYS